MKKLALLLCISAFAGILSAQDSTAYRFDLGLRTKKYVGFYLQSGFAGEFSFEKVLHHKMQFGFNFVTSTLGTAIAGNAIPTMEAELSVIKRFRHNKDLQPLVRLNFGYAVADYRSEEFDDLPQSSALVSFETGVSYIFPFADRNLRITGTGGLNFIAGSGVSGLATVYPVYGQLSLFYRMR